MPEKKYPKITKKDLVDGVKKWKEENEYICAECGGVFEKGWSDNEAHQEYESIFGAKVDAIPTAMVCDDCYKKLRRANEN